jgi:chitin disaccharide deacetylase
MESFEINRTRFIVTADDFGLSAEANRNILYLVELGKIDRVAVMPYGKISPQDLAQLSKSRVKLDIHLDVLHEFEENKARNNSILWRGFEFLLKIITGKLASTKVALDWENQIETFIELFKKKPDGLNSHEHVHFFPPLFKVAVSLQAKYEIPYIRFGNSVFVLHHKLIAYLLHILRKFNLRACGKNGCLSSGSLISLDWIDDFDKFLDKLPPGTIEVVCHPALAEDFEKIKKYF